LTFKRSKDEVTRSTYRCLFSVQHLRRISFLSYVRLALWLRVKCYTTAVAIVNYADSGGEQRYYGRELDGLRRWTVHRYASAGERICDLDLWPHDFENRNICGKFYWSPSTEYRVIWRWPLASDLGNLLAMLNISVKFHWNPSIAYRYIASHDIHSESKTAPFLFLQYLCQIKLFLIISGIFVLQ